MAMILFTPVLRIAQGTLSMSLLLPLTFPLLTKIIVSFFILRFGSRQQRMKHRYCLDPAEYMVGFSLFPGHAMGAISSLAHGCYALYQKASPRVFRIKVGQE